MWQPSSPGLSKASDAILCCCEQVIQLTEELLREAIEAEGASGAATAAVAAAAAAAPQPEVVAAPVQPSTNDPAALGSAPPPVSLPSMLPASVADQIRRAQVRGCLVSHHSM